jgi:membrane protease subunit HflK
MTSRLAFLVLAVLLAAYLATGFVVVPPGEVVVVRRLGRALPVAWTRGPHWGLPYGLDRLTRIRVDQVRRLSVGLVGPPGSEEEPGAGEFLTGDLNLLRTRAVVQYRIADPAASAFRVAQLEPLLSRLAESSLARALSSQGIDSALREGRPLVAREVEADLSRSVDLYGLGLSILGVNLTDTRPPQEVQPDFAAAQSAGSERERKLNEAKSYEVTTLKSARAQAQARHDQAKAQANRTVVLAKAKAHRFSHLLAEAERSPRLTVRRLYLDALHDLLPKVRRKVLLTPEEPVDISILGSEK